MIFLIIKIEQQIQTFYPFFLRYTTMFKLTKTTLPVVSALAAIVMGFGIASPSFAWGWNWGWPGSASEISNRDAAIGGEIAADSGHLSGQHNRLVAEDRAIRRQEHRELCQNGGYLTDNQKRQLNAEENNLQRQINYDFR
jgi:hypothetical protein